MASPGPRTWLVELTAVLVCLGTCHGALQLDVDRTGDRDFCARLRCWNHGNQDEIIASISAISLYDISDPNFRIQLATFNSGDSGIKINQSLSSGIVGTANISGYNADLSVNFRNVRDCQSGSFQCEMEYVNVNDQKETITIEDRANSTDQCDCNALNSQLSKLSRQVENNTRQINSLIQDNSALSSELAALRQQNSDLQQQFQNLSSQVSEVQDYLTSVQTSPSSTVSGSTPTTPATPTTKLSSSTTGVTELLTSLPSLGSDCSRGMAHTSPRVKFLLWGRIPALCDTETDGGGWVIIQRRTIGDQNFFGLWEAYKTGFGTPDKDFWLGNDAIHNLTSLGFNELRVDMTLNSRQYYAHYNIFSVDNELLNYRLTVSGYSGNAGDSLAYHNNMMFSTPDRDHDRDSGNCALHHTSAWWYNSCYNANLNGIWGRNAEGGVIWYGINRYASLSVTEMKVRQL